MNTSIVKYSMQRVAAIIPARFSSTRFPGKPLATLKGKILVQHVYEQASAAKLIDTVLVATDDEKIFDAVNSFGGRAVMTSESHASGTDRIAEAASGIDCEYVINVQGDEPFIRPEMIDETVRLLQEDSRVSISTLSKRINDAGEMFSPNVVKVVTDNEGFALYFSRAPIPFNRDEWLKEASEEGHKQKGQKVMKSFYCYKHIGIYGFRKDVLMKFTSMKPSILENIEKLEQLRALSNGLKIKVRETEFDTFGIDTIEDLRKAEEWQSTFS